MGRWQPDARGRLQRAALELYLEEGFEQTTVAQIAQRAGLTERTFFRNFTDKREVLFWGAESLRGLLVAAIADAPEDLAPMAVVMRAFEAAAPLMQDGRDFSRQRSTVIASHAGLQERELIKLASLGEAVAEALRRRSVPPPSAHLTAEVGIAVFKTAYDRWVGGNDGTDLVRCMRASFDELKMAAADA